jgi:hypothetical protein
MGDKGKKGWWDIGKAEIRRSRKRACQTRVREKKGRGRGGKAKRRGNKELGRRRRAVRSWAGSLRWSSGRGYRNAIRGDDLYWQAMLRSRTALHGVDHCLRLPDRARPRSASSGPGRAPPSRCLPMPCPLHRCSLVRFATALTPARHVSLAPVAATTCVHCPGHAITHTNTSPFCCVSVSVRMHCLEM